RHWSRSRAAKPQRKGGVVDSLSAYAEHVLRATDLLEPVPQEQHQARLVLSEHLGIEPFQARLPGPADPGLKQARCNATASVWIEYAEVHERPPAEGNALIIRRWLVRVHPPPPTQRTPDRRRGS